MDAPETNHFDTYLAAELLAEILVTRRPEGPGFEQPGVSTPGRAAHRTPSPEGPVEADTSSPGRPYEAAAARKRDGVQVAGAAAVLVHHPHDRPEKLKKGPAPLFHTATAEMRRFLWSLYAELGARFRDAAEKLRAGDLKPGFPPGCFPWGCRSCLGEALPPPSPDSHFCSPLAPGGSMETV